MRMVKNAAPRLAWGGLVAALIGAALLVLAASVVIGGPPEIFLRDRITLIRALAGRLDFEALEKLPGRRIRNLPDLPLSEPLEPQEQALAERMGFVVIADGIREGSYAIFVPVGFDNDLGYDLQGRCWQMDRDRITLLPRCPSARRGLP